MHVGSEWSDCKQVGRWMGGGIGSELFRRRIDMYVLYQLLMCVKKLTPFRFAIWGPRYMKFWLWAYFWSSLELFKALYNIYHQWNATFRLYFYYSIEPGMFCQSTHRVCHTDLPAFLCPCVYCKTSTCHLVLFQLKCNHYIYLIYLLYCCSPVWCFSS